MKLKPKSTVLNPKALLYRRFTNIEYSQHLQSIYKTISNGKYWIFDVEQIKFLEISSDLLPAKAKITEVENNTTILSYQGFYYKFNGSNWVSSENVNDIGVKLLSATFNNIAKYQVNKYYYVGSFDFMIKGSMESNAAQYIKGIVIPTSSVSIRTFSDDVTLKQDDLCVVNGRLYAIDNPEVTQKRMPKAFNIYYATLNSIL